MTAEIIQKKLKAYRKEAKAYVDSQRLLLRYGYECFFRRLIVSPYSSKLVLKGAMLPTTLELEGIRNTKDADFQMHGGSDERSVKTAFTEILKIEWDDAISFDLKSLTVAASGRERAYPGCTVKLRGALGRTPLTLQFDVGFGEIITPGAATVEIRTLVDFPTLKVKAYPWETVVAEKFEAIVKLGMRNNRMKDFYDLFTLATILEFRSEPLALAIIRTFEHRKTKLPTLTPVGLSQSFYKDNAKIKDWKAFIERHNLPNRVNLEDCCQKIQQFVGPLLKEIEAESQAKHTWNRAWKSSEVAEEP